MLRRLLEARMGKRGKREFVQVLRLLESFRLDDVAGRRSRRRWRAARSASMRSSTWCCAGSSGGRRGSI